MSAVLWVFLGIAIGVVAALIGVALEEREHKATSGVAPTPARTIPPHTPMEGK